MTKQIRIENADTSLWPVRVTGQYKDASGNWVDETSSTQIDHPTSMTMQLIHSGRRLIIEEKAKDEAPTPDHHPV